MVLDKPLLRFNTGAERPVGGVPTAGAAGCGSCQLVDYRYRNHGDAMVLGVSGILEEAVSFFTRGVLLADCLLLNL